MCSKAGPVVRSWATWDVLPLKIMSLLMIVQNPPSHFSFLFFLLQRPGLPASLRALLSSMQRLPPFFALWVLLEIRASASIIARAQCHWLSIVLPSETYLGPKECVNMVNVLIRLNRAQRVR